MLNLTKIELRGFKSFADKVEIPFNEGVTAIVGPNGCGKSNVADAVRWALAEQSAKILRGKNMQDVIFAGTEKRKSMSYCEVSLFFNNDEQHIFPSLPYDEVVITRKLDRSGSSEYYINRTRCRMKDIVTLFHDTGIGKEGYSIIGQGRIDEILSVKPDERRAIFEEAAGIAKFRANRNEAESKLEKTAANLRTANEIIAEIERQLAPLRRQAETAKKYFEIKEQLKHQEVNLYIYNYENNQSIKQKIYDRLAAAEKTLKEKDAEYNICVRRYDDCLRESSGIDRIYDENTAELLNLKVDAERAAGEENVIKERVSRYQADLNRLNAELASVDNQLITSDKLITAANAKKEDELQEYLELSKEFEEVQSKYDFLSKSLEGQESDLETRNKEYVRALEELGSLKTNLSGYITEKGIYEDRLKNLMSLLNSRKQRLDEEVTNLSVYGTKLKQARELSRNLTTEYNETLSNKLEASEAVKSYSDDIISLRSKMAALEAKLNMLVKIKEEYQGYQDAVKQLMRDAKNDIMLQNRIMGVLAEVISVPSEYETAVEYALGGALQNVLVADEHDASTLIAYLKQKNYGRATFRPLTSCRPHPLTGYDREVLKEPGCFGVAADLIEYEKKYDGFVQTLLGSTVVVDNINNAIRIFKKYNQAFKIVTLDGDIFTRGGEITGGSRRNQSSRFLSQEKDIEQAKTNLERHKSNIATMEAQQRESQQEVRDAEEKLEELSRSISDARIEIGLNEEKVKQAQTLTEGLNAEISENAIECETVKAAVKDLAGKIGSIDELERIVKDRQSEYGELLTTSKTKSTEQKSERELTSQKVMDLRLTLAGHKSALDACDADLFRLNRERGSEEEDKLDLIAELKSVQSSLEKIASAPEKKQFSKEDAEKIAVLERTIAELSERKRTISDEIVSLDADKTRIFNERNAVNEKKIRDEGMLENVDIEIRNMQEHILEEYDLSYSSALEFKEEDFKAYGAQTAISELKKSISKLGEVNPLAVEDLKNTEERYDDCVRQRDDIQNACDDIMKVINELTGEMQAKFTDAFDKINANFQTVFKQLFGGGKGYLNLDMKETDDPLLAGIEIFAQPPGKKLQHISLLSGGERAFTAIAILFSILQLKPMPFCVLDEIEAALDDSNVSLLADYLKMFSDYTQFIVITHKKPTMSKADSIFGVTMEEQGVTKIVSIELEEAIKRVEDDEKAERGRQAV